MNIVIIDGVINSLIGRVTDARRSRARFTVATKSGDEVGVEVRGPGAEKLWAEWEPGDGVHVRGRLTAGGFVAADFIRRRQSGHGENSANMEPPSSIHPLQVSLGIIPTFGYELGIAHP